MSERRKRPADPTPTWQPTIQEATHQVTTPHEPRDSLPVSRMGQPHVVVLSGPEAGKIFTLQPGDNIIGRSPEVQIYLPDAGISRKHTRLTCDRDGLVWISDLSSKNGTWVEGERVTQDMLADGDRIRIGTNTLLRFGYQDEVIEASADRLYLSATRDASTGLLNRRAFVEILTREILWHSRHESSLAVVLLDVDHFRRITEPTIPGDVEIPLPDLARLCQKVISGEHVLARWGAAGIMVLMRETTLAGAAAVAEEVRQTVDESMLTCPGEKPSRSMHITVSVGVVALQGKALSDPQAMLHLVERCVYASRQQGGNRVTRADALG